MPAARRCGPAANPARPEIRWARCSPDRAAGGGRYQAEILQLQRHPAPAVDSQPQRFRRSPPRSACAPGCVIKSCVTDIQLLLPLAQIARGPVELAQTVQNGALHAVLGVALENDFLVRIVFRRGIEQPQHAGMHQIVQIHVHRQALMNANRDGLHQRKILEHDPIPRRPGCCFLLPCRSVYASHIPVAPFRFRRISVRQSSRMQRDNQSLISEKGLSFNRFLTREKDKAVRFGTRVSMRSTETETGHWNYQPAL